MRTKPSITIIIILAFITVESKAALNDYSLFLRAQPQAIVADSFSTTTITAEVRDSTGRSVPDGTQVDFTTSLGIIEHTARTSSGVARVRLQSDTTIGTAMVSAVVSAGRAVANINVDFLAPGTEMFDESFISVSSTKHLGYDVGKQIVDSAGGVQISHRGVDITAEEAQIDVRKNILRAKARLGGDSIRVTRGDKTISASALYYDLNSMNGVIFTPAEEGAKRFLFRGRDMFIQPDEEPDEKVVFDFQPVEISTMFIRARALLIRPGEEIKIKRASFYMEGDKILSVPLHVVSLSGRATGINQMLTYGTEGLRMDLPIYYSLTPNGTGSFRLRHSEPSGWGTYNGRAGWQVDMEQDYTQGGSTEGSLAATRITSGDWGLRWNHRKEFDNNSRLYTYIDYPAHQNLYSTIDYSMSFGDYNLSLNLRGNVRDRATDSYTSNIFLQSHPKNLVGNAITYGFTTRLSYNSLLSSENGNKFGQALGLQFYGKTLKVGGGSLNSSLTAGREWGGMYPGSSVYANLGYSRNLGMIGTLGLNYTYSWADSSFGYNAQRLSTDIYMSPSQAWNSHVYATYGLDDGSVSAFGDFGYTFAQIWRASIQGTYQKLPLFDYTDTEVALARAMGKQEVRIIWSQSRKRFRVEFSALSF